ncbi:MAG: aminoacyl-tRNA hydrolase [Lentisphaeria bacterium]|nr:aminoacyl-tRNA hydrolase [Lentisphaeria bacterium]
MNVPRSVTAQDIPEDELREEFLCTAAGPGGQHVNRTANTVRLFFDPAASSLLTPGAQKRLKKAAGADENGLIVITCRETRSLTRNRERAREILAEMISRALVEPRKRKKTRPTRASKEKRLQDKSRRSQIKAGRSGKYE